MNSRDNASVTLFSDNALHIGEGEAAMLALSRQRKFSGAMMQINGIKTEHHCSMLLASANLASLDRLIGMLSGIASLACANTRDLLQERLLQLRPEILLLDHHMPGMNGAGDVSRLRKLWPGIKIVMLGTPSSDEDELAMIRAGARGVCPHDVGESTLKLMLNAVQNGELWIKRSLTSLLLEQLRDLNRPPTGTDGAHSSLKDLTQREYEIAMRVGNGETNKHIAYSLEISERTVKAHLSSIFRKTGVTDRLKVALILSANKR